MFPFLHPAVDMKWHCLKMITKQAAICWLSPGILAEACAAVALRTSS